MPNDSVAKIEQEVRWTPRHPFLAVRTTHASRQPYATHLHATLSLGLVFSGATLLTRGGRQTRLREGDMVLIAPGEAHSCNPVDSRPRGYHMFYIDTAWALSLLGGSEDERLTTTAEPVRDAECFAALMALAEAVRGDRDYPGSGRALENIVKQTCAVRRADPTTAAHDALPDLARAHPDAPVAELAAMAGLGRETFIRAFRRAAGTTPGSYRQCLRLGRALSLLRDGLDIAAAAADCGYADQSHLHRMCVKYFSATPGQLKPKTSLSFKK